MAERTRRGAVENMYFCDIAAGRSPLTSQNKIMEPAEVQGTAFLSAADSLHPIMIN